MKTTLAFCLFFAFQIINVYAGDTATSWLSWRKTWPKEYLYEIDIDRQMDSNVIRSITLLDVRSDPTSVGLYTSRSQKPHTVIPANTLSALFNSKLATNPQGKELLFVIRSFWINELNSTVHSSKQTLPNYGGGATTFGGSDVNVSSAKLKCAIDVFVHQNQQYYPLTRLDTLLFNGKKVGKAAEKLVTSAFELLNKKIAKSIASGRYTRRKSAGIDVIKEDYEKVFQIPALLNDTIKIGIFYTWEQFKNNQPELGEFIIQKNDKEPPTLYIRDNGKEILTRNVFALCDGKKVYKVQEGYVFELFRDKRSIYWMGVERKDVSTRSIPILFPTNSVSGFGMEAVGTKLRILLSPYLLNLETGSEY